MGKKGNVGGDGAGFGFDTGGDGATLGGSSSEIDELREELRQARTCSRVLHGLTLTLVFIVLVVSSVGVDNTATNKETFEAARSEDQANFFCSAWGHPLSAMTGEDTCAPGQQAPSHWDSTVDLSNWPGFPALLSAVESIDGDFVIGPNVKHLRTFAKLRNVTGSIKVVGTALETFSLPLLDFVGGSISVSQNDKLTSLDGAFPTLVKVGGALDIVDNEKLGDFNGFPVLQQLGARGTLETRGPDGAFQFDISQVAPGIGQKKPSNRTEQLALFQTTLAASVTIANNPSVWAATNATTPPASANQWFPALEAVGTLDIAGEATSESSILNMSKLGIFGKLQNIIGNLNVEQTDLHNLTVLKNVQFVAGSLRMQNNLNMTTDALKALRRVNDSMVLSGNPNLGELQLCRVLERVDVDVEVTNNGLLALDCPKLGHIGEDVTINANPNATRLSFANLSHVGKTLTVTANDKLSDLQLPSLTHAGEGLVVTNNAELKALGIFASLVHIGAAPVLEQKDSLSQNILPVWEFVDGDVTVTGKGSTQTKTCSVKNTDVLTFEEQLWEKGAYDNLRNITGSLEVSGSNVQHFAAFTNLGEVGGDLKIQNNINLELAKATIGSIFPSLTAIAGDLLIENNKQLNQLSGFGQLGTVGSLNIARNSKLSAIKAGTFASLQVVDGSLVVRNNALLENLEGIFTSLTEVSKDISLTSNLNLKVNGNVFPSLIKMGIFAVQGKQTDNIMRNLSLFSSFDKVTNITEDVRISSTDLEEMFPILPAVEEVGGSVVVSNNGFLKQLANTLPSLRACKSVGIRYNAQLTSITSFATSLAETGDVDISNNRELKQARDVMPSLAASGGVTITGNPNLDELDGESWKTLQTVEGDLEIKGTQLQTIDAFGSARNISGKVQIIENKALQVPSSTFKNLVHAGGVEVSRNYNISQFHGFAKLETIKGSLLYTRNGPEARFGAPSHTVEFTAFRALEEASSISISDDLYIVEFPVFSKLKKVETLAINSNARLATLASGSFGALRNVSKELTITNNNKLDLSKNDFNMLEHAGQIHIRNNLLSNPLDCFAKLATIDAELTVESNDNLTSAVNGFPMLRKSGSITISRNNKLASIPATAFGALKTAGSIQITENANLADAVAFVALEKALGSIRVNDNAQLTSLGKFEKLVGIGEVLEIVNNPGLELDRAAFAQLGEICGAVTLSASRGVEDAFKQLGWDTTETPVNFATLREQMVQDYAPDFKADYNTNTLRPLINFLPVKSITLISGDLVIDYNSAGAKIPALVEFALLTTIQGNLEIATSMNGFGPENLKFPKLSDVQGNLLVPTSFQNEGVFPAYAPYTAVVTTTVAATTTTTVAASTTTTTTTTTSSTTTR